MDKKKLSEIINGIDDKYLVESEQTDIENDRSKRVVFIAIAAVFVAVVITGVVLKVTRINTENTEDLLVGATTAPVIDIMTESELAFEETTGNELIGNSEQMTNYYENEQNYILDNFKTTYFGNYNNAKLVYRSFYSSHCGDDNILRHDACTISEELFYLKISSDYEIKIENPEYYFSYADDETNSYGISYADTSLAKNDINNILKSGAKVFRIKGYENIKLIVSNNKIYVETGITYGMYEIKNSSSVSMDVYYKKWDFYTYEITSYSDFTLELNYTKWIGDSNGNIEMAEKSQSPTQYEFSKDCEYYILVNDENGQYAQKKVEQSEFIKRLDDKAWERDAYLVEFEGNLITLISERLMDF